jgi:hypothetical protein
MRRLPFKTACPRRIVDDKSKLLMPLETCEILISGATRGELGRALRSFRTFERWARDD